MDWYGLVGRTPRYPTPYGVTAKPDQIYNYGMYWTWDATNPDTPIMCLNSKGWYENYYLNAIHNINDFDGDGLRIDCCTPQMCKNTLHGCSSSYSCEALSYYNFCRDVDTFFKSKTNENGREYILGAATNNNPAVNAYMDLALAGEGWTTYPTDADRDSIFTSFLFGRDFLKLSGGNSPTPVDTPKIFEMMLARCGTILYWSDYTGPQVANWMKYFNPLRVFNVNNCAVHHPFHYDYSNYTSELSDKVFPIVYNRQNEALVVLCNESDAGGSGTLVLNAASLGFSGQVMVFEPFTGTYRLVNISNGSIQIPVTYPAPWDADFYYVRTVPQSPAVIWNDARIWKIDQTWNNALFSVKVSGIPEVTYSYIDIYTAGQGCPVNVSGAVLLSYNPADGMARFKFLNNNGSLNIISMNFDPTKNLAGTVNTVDLYNQLVSTMQTVTQRTAYKTYRDIVQSKINTIRDNGNQIPDDRKKEILTYLMDTERLLYACTEVRTYTEIPTTSVQSPAGLVKSGWNLVSLPVEPLDSSPDSVLNGIDLNNASVQLWDNKSNGGGYLVNNINWWGPMKVGDAYWLVESADKTISYTGVPNDSSDKNIVIPAHSSTPYWILIGHPYDKNIACENIKFTVDNITKSWSDSISAGWIEASAQGFDSKVQGYFNAGLNTNPAANRYAFEPWYGYWMLVRTSKEITITVPTSPVAP